MAAGLYRLGKNYYAIHNYEEAKNYLIRAVVCGSSAAAHQLLMLGRHFLKMGGQENFRCAEDCFQALADRGSGEGCLWLGRMARDGLGRARDIQEAFQDFSEAYRLGNLQAAYEAGCLMLPDAMVSPEVREIAKEWFQAAADDGVAKAYTQMGLLLCDNLPAHHKEALSWFIKGIQAGDPDAMIGAADIYISGIGVMKNVSLALSLLRKAAGEGSSKANRILGRFYEEGQFVERDRTLAQAYRQRAERCAQKEQDSLTYRREL